MGEYQINKGVGRQVEFQGLTAQYLVLFVAGLLGVFVCFAGMYMSGIPQGFCILFALAAGLGVTGCTFYLSRRFGSHGLQKLMASRRHPRRIVHRRAVGRLLRFRRTVKP
ncbi:DUF4133 domain-containing protein [Alistipes finegoldii]|uniref:DUF4133 domain-containing protein n=1 Tax=Alistipes finegoldii TaxID=214856 RepID=UPI00242D004E|nr:DUF4133 domain-containing protein [Alistipes finegoldii]